MLLFEPIRQGIQQLHGSTGQVFIFLTIAWFGPDTNAKITTIRGVLAHPDNCDRPTSKLFLPLKLCTSAGS